MGKVFISYSHRDRKWKDRLLTRLGVLEKAGLIEVWDDRRIEEGDKGLLAMEQAIASVDTAILLVTENFLNSESIIREEVPRLIRRWNSDSLRLIPILAEPCDWENREWLHPIQVRTIKGMPLSDVEPREIYADLSKLAKELIGFPRPDTPLQLPPDVENFTGRETELARLLEGLLPGRVTTLCGPGGIGKTALAAEAILCLVSWNELADRFPDGIVFHSFHGRPDMALAFEHIVRSFDGNARDTSVDAVRSILGRKQALLILDGVEEAENFRGVLEIRGRCGVLVTSLSKQDAEGRRHDIGPLPVLDAARLLRDLAGDLIEQPTGDGKGIDAAREICEFTGRLPLAVLLAGRYMTGFGMRAETCLAWMKDSPLAAKDQEKRREQSVPLLLAQCIARVPEQARQALALTGLLALAPFGKEAVASALGINAFEAAYLLGRLVDYGLLKRSGTRYEISHPLIHTYVRKHLSPPARTSERLTAFFIVLTRKQSEKGPEGYARLDPDRIHLMRILSMCMERKAWEPALEMAWAADDYMDFQGYWPDRITLLKAGLEAAKNLGKQHDAGAMLGNLGLACSGLGQFEKAIGFFEEAIAISRKIHDRRGEGNRLGNLGLACYALGRVKKAIGFYEKALAISREIHDRRGEGNRLGSLGLAWHALEQVEKAIGYYKQAFAISREIGDLREQGSDLDNLGLAYSDLGQVEKAIEIYEKALAISRKIGDRQKEGGILGKLGLACRIKGQLEKAIGYFGQALAISKETGDRQEEGGILGNLGLASHALKQMGKAIGFYEKALPILRETGDRQMEVTILGSLGSACSDIGQMERAIWFYEKALTILRETGDRQMEGTILGSLGSTYGNLGQVKRAIRFYAKALSISRAIGARSLEVDTLGNLGNAYYSLGQVEKAIGFYEKALTTSREIGNRLGEGACLGNLGSVYKGLGQVKKAISYLKQSLAILEEVRSPEAGTVRAYLEKLEKGK